jgi:hypothetical protein
MIQLTNFRLLCTIHDFFSAYSLSQARREMAKLFRAASSRQVWKGVPANLLFLQEKLQELMDAAFALNNTWHKDEAAIVKPNWQDGLWPFNSKATYYGWHQKEVAWHFFPRHLSKKEFLNPYHAIQQFSKYADQSTWTETLHYIVHHALSQSAYQEYGYTIPLIEAERLLYKLWKPATWFRYVPWKGKLNNQQQTAKQSQPTSTPNKKHGFRWKSSSRSMAKKVCRKTYG